MSKLTNNTADLQAILDKVNALPDAGSGGGNVETCTVSITYDGPAIANTEGKIYYTDETQTAQETVFVWGNSYKVVKGSMIRLRGGSFSYPISSGTNYTYVESFASDDTFYFITGDVAFSIA